MYISHLKKSRTFTSTAKRQPNSRVVIHRTLTAEQKAGYNIPGAQPTGHRRCLPAETQASPAYATTD